MIVERAGLASNVIVCQPCCQYGIKLFSTTKHVSIEHPLPTDRFRDLSEMKGVGHRLHFLSFYPPHSSPPPGIHAQSGAWLPPYRFFVNIMLLTLTNTM